MATCWNAQLRVEPVRLADDRLELGAYVAAIQQHAGDAPVLLRDDVHVMFVRAEAFPRIPQEAFIAQWSCWQEDVVRITVCTIVA